MRRVHEHIRPAVRAVHESGLPEAVRPGHRLRALHVLGARSAPRRPGRVRQHGPPLAEQRRLHVDRRVDPELRESAALAVVSPSF